MHEDEVPAAGDELDGRRHGGTESQARQLAPLNPPPPQILHPRRDVGPQRFGLGQEDDPVDVRADSSNRLSWASADWRDESLSVVVNRATASERGTSAMVGTPHSMYRPDGVSIWAGYHGSAVPIRATVMVVSALAQQWALACL